MGVIGNALGKSRDERSLRPMALSDREPCPLETTVPGGRRHPRRLDQTGRIRGRGWVTRSALRAQARRHPGLRRSENKAHRWRSRWYEPLTDRRDKSLVQSTESDRVHTRL